MDGAAVAVTAALRYLNAHHDSPSAVRTPAGIATARRLRDRALAAVVALSSVTDLGNSQNARRALLLLQAVMHVSPDAPSIDGSQLAQVMRVLGDCTPAAADDPPSAQRMLPAAAKLALVVVGQCVEQAAALGPGLAGTSGEPQVTQARAVARSMQAGQVTRYGVAGVAPWAPSLLTVVELLCRAAQ